ncbi:Catechol 2,3-dioxygenase [Variovorax sp. OK605]|jgi:catechol 2,3-dioxygenase-like lactoylglutathione lyase family enzyme|uniref:VOC family protein n=1 Tax=unclassified Variovorax TaxID=663243 RepID=UPI0008CFF490|nr:MULTISPECIES: VOC family protein [unclassified Variovorax]SEJ69314.1 Catechol 2,3-dioxygenase [Variovorax sp. OK202]SFC79021.1 Catechol 2,3-dioxygenase [Variovorax sp. OK212]SFO60097.1 Catechol 2,3-dioxygenase [Variovorax sp. OK605]
MYDHIGLKVKDLCASRRFYEAALAPLGHVPGSHDDSYAGIGPADAPALWLYAAKDAKDANGPGTHVAFRAPNHEAVAAFHQAGLKAGGTDNGGAGPRPDYSPTYYAAFLIDPDGNNVEAVCL